MTTAMSLANMVIGLAFQTLIAAALGLGAFADAFQVAWVVLTFGAVTFASLAPSLFVPRFYLSESESVALGDLGAVLALGVLFSLLQAGVGIFLGGEAGAMIIWCAPAQFFAAGASVAQSVAYIQRRFALAAMGPIVNGIALLLLTWFSQSQLNAASLGMALLGGYVAQAVLVSMPFAWSRPTIRWVRALGLRTLIGVTAFTLVAKLQPVLERVLSVYLVQGAATALGFGQKIAQGILMVAAFGLALTATATLTQHVRSGDLARAAEVLAKTFLSTLLFSAICIAGAVPLVYFVVKILFERGSISPADTLYISDIVLLQLPWVLGSALTGVFTNFLYVDKSYLRVLWASLIGIAAMLGASLFVSIWSPKLAVAVGSSVAAFASLAWAWWLVVNKPIAPQLIAQLGRHKSLIGASIILPVSASVGYGIGRIALGPESFGTAILAFGCAAIAVVIALAKRSVRSSMQEVLLSRV